MLALFGRISFVQNLVQNEIGYPCFLRSFFHVSFDLPSMLPYIYLFEILLLRFLIVLIKCSPYLGEFHSFKISFKTRSDIHASFDLPSMLPYIYLFEILLLRFLIILIKCSPYLGEFHSWTIFFLFWKGFNGSQRCAARKVVAIRG